ncbi:MAG: T9SS type A sorting domain-containing protein [bacterium]|nr:T9SS type A sorting domain-containing protein [bacterium]
MTIGHRDSNESYAQSDVFVPPGTATLKLIPGPNEFPYVASSRTGGSGFQSFCLIQAAAGLTPLVAFDSSSSCPASFAYESDLQDNVVAFGYAAPTPPLRGMRFDVIGAESGDIEQTYLVEGMGGVEPVTFKLLDDNTAISVSLWENDIVIARTDTIPSRYFAPDPPTLDLLVEGPPAWGYRINSGSLGANFVHFLLLGNDATGTASGLALGRWTSERFHFDVIFNAEQGLASHLSSDTLWLNAPECESADIRWAVGSSNGVIRGPFHPELSVQEYLVRTEERGVSVRFTIADATNLDSMFIWRRTSTSPDSVLIKSWRAYAGHYVVPDEDVEAGKRYTYYLTGTDALGRQWSIDGASQEVYVDPAVFVPTEYFVYPPYPNPFNANVTFKFDVAQISRTTLKLFDITGRLVATVVDEWKDPGTYTVSYAGLGLATGVYIYRFESWRLSHSGKLLLLK